MPKWGEVVTFWLMDEQKIDIEAFDDGDD